MLGPVCCEYLGHPDPASGLAPRGLMKREDILRTGTLTVGYQFRTLRRQTFAVGGSVAALVAHSVNQFIRFIETSLSVCWSVAFPPLALI